MVRTGNFTALDCLFLCFVFMYLKQNAFEMTNGVESHASTQLHMNGLTNKTRGDQTPDRDELKEAGTKHPNAQGVKNEVTEQAW